jgi:tripartite-type tricarboxylate transporter receptor subunit TctC
LLVLKRTPTAIVHRLDVEAVRALALPQLHARLSELRLEVIGNSPEQFAAAIRSVLPKWAKLIKDSGIKAD